MYGETEGTMKSACQELQNEPPHDIVTKSLSGPPPYHLIHRFWIGFGLGWPERDFGATVQLCHVGARIKALDALIFMAPLVLPCLCLRPQIELWNDVL